MTLRLRFILDTNILIPLQDSNHFLEKNLANFVRLANTGGHQLLYHPATIEDFRRDPDIDRRNRNLQRVSQYSELDNPAPCPWNTPATSANDACDNEILYALECEAAHALVTEDKGIHAKALAKGLQNRVYSIQTAEDWLKRLHEPTAIHLPNIEDLPLHRIIPTLSQPFFDSLREGYDGFDNWFRTKARENRRAWSGKVRPIAFTSTKRQDFSPNTPTISEYKPLQSYELENWFGLFAPANTPESIISKINAAVTKALKDPALAKKLRDQGGQPSPMTPQQFAEFIKKESAVYARIVEKAKITAE